MIALLLFGILASVLLHELAHVVVGNRMGWRVSTLTLTRRGPVVRLTTNNSHTLARTAWAVALAGPLANILVGLLLLGLGSPLAHFLGLFNLLIALVNLAPLRGSDGAMAYKSLRGQLP